MARLGGDEFAVVLPEVSADQAATVTAAVKSAIADHTRLLIGQQLRGTASIGFVTFDSSQNADDILAAADAEMYAAKRSA